MILKVLYKVRNQKTKPNIICFPQFSTLFLSEPSPIMHWFSKIDWRHPGVWRCPLKTCWGCFCCWCWLMRIVLATVCCRFGSWGLVSLAVWWNLLVVISGFRFIFLCMKWMWNGKEYGDKTSRNWYLSPGDLKSINQSHSDWHQRWNLRSDKKVFSNFC